MKNKLVILLCLPMISFGQLTYVPDDNFEQKLIDLGYDNILDDYVITANIVDIETLTLDNSNINDLTGIEDFSILKVLSCNNNFLNDLDLSNNFLLDSLFCYNNQISNLDLTSNIELTLLGISQNPISNIDITNNINLQYLFANECELTELNVTQNPSIININCSFNEISNIDLSQNNQLIMFYAMGNLFSTIDMSFNDSLQYLYLNSDNLTHLDLRNGNNNNMLVLFIDAPNLHCVSVDDAIWSNLNWIKFELPEFFSDDCDLETFGCTDSLSCNYDIDATMSDSSCVPQSQSYIISIDTCDSYTMNNISYYSSGVYIDTSSTNMYNCDSIVYLNLTIL